MRRKTVNYVVAAAVLTAGAVAFVPRLVCSHCQIPCGIYDDAARVARMHEDATTIEKSIVEINALAGKTDAQSANQLARWVANKEAHASHIITTVAEYFLTQRVRPVVAGDEGYDAYLKKLADHHAVMVAAMKAKQNADAQYATGLYTAIDALGQYYDTTGHNHE